MKTLHLVRWAVGICLGSLLVGGATAQNPPVTLRVGLYQNPPEIFTDETGQPAGIFVDILAAIAEAEHWTLDYVPGSWAENLDRVATGEIDLMPGVAITAERAERYAFHAEPVLSDWFQIYAPPDATIRSLLDLDGRRVATVSHSLQEEAFTTLANGFGLHTTLVPAKDFAAAFDMVLNGQADAVVASRFAGSYLQRTKRLADTAVIFNPSRSFFVAPPTVNPLILRIIDQHLVRMKQDPDSVYHHALRHWATEDVHTRIPRWLPATGAALAVLLLLVLAWNAALNRQVARRTAQLELQNEESRLLASRVKAGEARMRFHAQLLDSVRESVVASDLEGRITFWSRGAERLYGYSAVEVMGKPYRDFAGPIQPPPEEDFRRELIARGCWQGEHQQKNRRGETFWTSTFVSLVRDEDGRHAGYIGLDLPLTEKQAEHLQNQSRCRD
ncbi:MAG: transporter substrate-binding domain-containing protein [Kiritimatiellia bacterium]|nr:transporter substrate-binding domain-containing protein [Kiritimatiellia bacterium]